MKKKKNDNKKKIKTKIEKKKNTKRAHTCFVQFQWHHAYFQKFNSKIGIILLGNQCIIFRKIIEINSKGF